MKGIWFVVLIGMLVPTSVLRAQAPPHSVIFSPVYFSDGATHPLGADLHFDAYVSVRPDEHLDEISPGGLLADGYVQLECASFPTQWSPGETLVVYIIADGSNWYGPEGGEFRVELTSGGAQTFPATLAPMPEQTVILVPLHYGDGLTPMLVRDVYFTAYISIRPGEIVAGDAINGGVFEHPYGTAIRVDREEFPTTWTMAEELVLDITGDGSNYTGPEAIEIRIHLTPYTLYWARRLPAP